jgi:cystathionine gamma-synthase
MSDGQERKPTARKSGQGISTQSVRGGEAKFKDSDALTTPIYQTSTYVFESTSEILAYNDGEVDRYEYGRYGNPTQRAAELKIAELEGAEDALLFPSGMNAIGSTLLARLKAGDHVIFVEDCYRNTRRFCELVLAKFGVDVTPIRAFDYGQLEAELRPNTRALICEIPTNPHLRVPDLERLVALSEVRGFELLLDATLATPFNVRPSDYGVRMVLHSVTKFLNGHQDLLAGVLVGSANEVAQVRQFCRPVGGIPDPHQSWLILRGLKTFALRMEQHNRNAQAIAEFLSGHSRVEQTWYPGLASHPDHELAKRQLKGFGGLVSFTVRGDQKDTLRFADNLQLWLLGPSLGGVESLASHPATVSYSDWPRSERDRLGISDNLIRLAVGIEDPADLITDLDRALSSI